MSTGQGREVEAARALLRGLATGLSIHRLYPDRSDATSFVSACERIVAAAEDATASGPVDIVLRSATFQVGEERISDPGIDRLAEACFERRVELLGVERVPTRDELFTWFTLLSTDVGEVERAGGLDVAMRERGVTAIRATSRAPMPSSGERVAPELLGLSDWIVPSAAEHAHGASSAAALVLELRPGETGPALYTRLAELFTSGAADHAASGFFTKAARVASELPRAERAVFGIRLFDRLTTETFAEQYAGHLTDLGLADLIDDVAWFLGRDPEELAGEVAERASRHATLAGLFATGSRRSLRSTDGDGTDDLPDASALLDGFPASPEHERALAVTALVDVLLNEPREPHLVALLDNVIEQLRGCVRDGEIGPIEELLAGLDAAAAAAPDELAGRLARPRARTLEPDLLAEVCAASLREGAPLDPAVLVPFETHAIPALVGALAAAPDAPTRTQLLDALVHIGSGHDGIVAAALDGQPPDLVVKLAPMVGRATGLDVVSLLSDLASRANTPVLHAIIDALAFRPPERSAPIIARIVRRTSDAALQAHGIETLAELPNRVGHRQLDELARGEGATSLPRKLRRRARRLTGRRRR